MFQSVDDSSNFFESLANTGVEVLQYFRSYDWDVEAATNAFLDNLQQQRTQQASNLHSSSLNSDPSTPESFNENNGHSSQAGVSNDYRQTTNSSSLSSQQLNHPPHQTTNVDLPGKTSFDEHCNCFISNTNGTFPFFPDIRQHYHDRRHIPHCVNSNIIGNNLIIQTPWGNRKAIYADYTATGRSLLCVEQYIIKYVLPYYANTHSEHSAFAATTTHFRESSRSLIKKCVNCNDDDVVIFTGSGSTGAINKMVGVLQLRDITIRNQYVVFVSTTEHHSNILPWQETGVEFIRIPNNLQGLLDQENLERQLGSYHKKKKIICTFSAASNVTGVLADVNDISELVHTYDGLIFWDYAAAAPHVPIDMNPSSIAAKDAVFISAHKFVGGPGATGLLIAKKKTFENAVPAGPGGGTVNYVTRTLIEYVHDIETREESGTPNILGSIRAGLVFALKNTVGHEIIVAREDELVVRFIQQFRNSEKLIILGPLDVPRLAIFSFLIYVPLIGKYLHHNFVCSLLNDLFGIQVRSGCSCAGPYVLDLLKIDEKTANIYTRFITENPSRRIDDDNSEIPQNALMKPGFTRLNLSYFIDDNEVNYILKAVDFISKYGWRFLPLYTYNTRTAIWRSRHMPMEDQFNIAHQPETTSTSISSHHFARQISLVNSSLLSTDDPFQQAETLSNGIAQYVYKHLEFIVDAPMNIPERHQSLIWFIEPNEAVLELLFELRNQQQKSRTDVPFRAQYRS
ncbi:unnamed protein product [Rotaria socialis]|uniref:Aminotransferase class V domain-containing protein n=1 Tax=Rotaria socialis TaxID=392032 RepID=A0A818NQH4_9BILA|nr:unnamed protein product [Rotaria socialis]CAF3607490.1 unnamed protein product [Rotaria socialis]CAF4530142.1 unnamed protein product [Rotaria socialis]CAF4850640.1 unnamed protein product [Rotaria socialis]